MVSWSSGSLSGYSAYESEQKSTTYQLATTGTVDVNGGTRLQVNTPGMEGIGFPPRVNTNRLNAYAKINITSADLANNLDRRFTLSMFMVPASAFAAGVVPTPQQILAAPGVSVRRATISATGAGSFDFVIPGPLATTLTPNTKYWVLVMPTVYIVGSTPSVANDKPPSPHTPNNIGRALSMWTNRKPSKPVFTSPPPNASVAPGSRFQITVKSDDPDKVSPNRYGRENEDVAGVQFQYSAVPTEANPNPPWLDFTFYDSWGDPWQAAFITGQDDWHQLSGRDFMVRDMGMPVWAGPVPTGEGQFRETLRSLKSVLPIGAWRLRARTFDFGHPYPELLNPLGDISGAYRADTYPAPNTSDWSDPLVVTVLDQVPPAIPLSPVLDTAVTEGATVNLIWRYRNAFVPPYPQGGREVQIRKVGATNWTTLANGLSTQSSITISGADPLPPGAIYFPLEAGTRYEWRVRTTDAAGVSGNWSDAARFWAVANLNSGGEMPVPSGSIFGATIGCGTHTAYIYRRGGKTPVARVRGVSYLDWHRVRDDISTSKIVVSMKDIDNGNLLAKLQAWAYEIVIYRNNGFKSERVWEGPITALTYRSDSVTIVAKDVMAYAYRRIIKQAMNDTANGDTVTSRAARVLQNALAPDDPNLLAYLTVVTREDDARQYRSVPPYSRTSFEEVDDMASNAGLDYTAVGRRIILWGTKNRIGTLPRLKDEDLGNSPIVSEYGMSMANRYVVSDGNGVWGEATRLDENGLDPTYGLVEMLSSTWASDSPEDSGTYTQAGLEKVRKSFADSAERSIDDRYPPPVVVRIPDNTTLNPSTVLSIQQLVPGVVIPLTSTATLRKVRANQKLDAVKVIETAGAETISLTMSPFGGVVLEEGEEVE